MTIRLFRGDGSDSVRRGNGSSASDILLDPDHRFEQEGQDLLAVDAGQGQRDLGLDDAELDSQVKPGPTGFQRKIPLPSRERIEGRRELDLAQLADVLRRTSSSSSSKTIGVSTCMPKKQR